MRRLPVAALTAALFSGASPADMQAANNVSIAYRWTNGSVAPGNFTEYFIEIRAEGESEISLRMGRQEGDEQRVSAAFYPDPSELAVLLDYVRKRHKKLMLASARYRSAPTPPGAELCRLVLVESRTTRGLPCGFGGTPSLAERVRHLVPETVMQSIDAQHADFLAKRAALQEAPPR